MYVVSPMDSVYELSDLELKFLENGHLQGNSDVVKSMNIHSHLTAKPFYTHYVTI